MNRSKLQRLRLDYCNDRLDPATREAVERALRQHPDLAADYDLLAGEIRAYRRLGDAGPDPDPARVARIREGASARLRPAFPTRRAAWVTAWGGAAALVAFAWFVQRPGDRPAETPVATAPVEPTRVQLALSRRNGAVRLYLSLPARDEPEESR